MAGRNEEGDSFHSFNHLANISGFQCSQRVVQSLFGSFANGGKFPNSPHKMILQGVVGRTMFPSPQRGPRPNPRTWDYVTLHGKRDVVGVIKVHKQLS